MTYRDSKIVEAKRKVAAAVLALEQAQGIMVDDDHQGQKDPQLSGWDHHLKYVWYQMRKELGGGDTPEIMKPALYVLYSGVYSDREVLGVFSTPEQAKEFRQAHEGDVDEDGWRPSAGPYQVSQVTIDPAYVAEDNGWWKGKIPAA